MRLRIVDCIECNSASALTIRINSSIIQWQRKEVEVVCHGSSSCVLLLGKKEINTELVNFAFFTRNRNRPIYISRRGRGMSKYSSQKEKPITALPYVSYKRIFYLKLNFILVFFYLKILLLSQVYRH